MRYQYRNSGVCSSGVRFDIGDDSIVRNIEFVGGCDGNTTGICRLAEGMTAKEVVERLSGIRCGYKSTSCPDQLAKAVSAAMAEGGRS